MKFHARLWPFLFAAAALSADPPPYVIATAAGYIPGDTPLALQQNLVQPAVVAYDPYGTLYYGTAHQVWRLNPDGTDTLVAGSGNNSISQLDDNGQATSASLIWVAGLAIDAQQNVYISDLEASEVRKVTPAGIIVPFAGSLSPGPLTIDSANLYVSNSANASIMAFTLDGKTSKVIAGGHGNQSSGDGGPAANASLFYPGVIALANQILYINEAAGARIRQVNLRTGVISTLVQLMQSFATNNGNPGLAADTDGEIYVQHANGIDCIAPNTTTLQPYAGGGNANPGDPGPALDATLLSPTSLAVNPLTHDLSLADSTGNIVQTISDANATIQTVAGLVHFAGDNGPAALAIFDGLESVVGDSQGNLYLADVGNNRIRKIDTNGIVTTIAGNGIVGFAGDGGPATTAALNLKHAAAFANNLAIDSSGNLYVSDYGNGRIREISTSGVISTIAGGGQAAITRGQLATSASILPGPVAADGDGNIYFGNVSTGLTPSIAAIYKIDSNGQLSAFAGGSVSPAIGYARCLITDGSGNFYLCDSANNVVRKIAPSGATSTVASIQSPTAAALDSDGNLYVYSLGQVSEIAGATSPQSIAGNPLAPMVSSGDGGWASQATFSSIAGMAVDPSGNLYLTDGGIYLREAMPVGSSGLPPIINSGGIVGAGASNPPVQSASPGAIVSIYGANFSSSGAQSLLAMPNASGQLPTNLGGICVNFGSTAAPITGVFPNQVNVQVPALPPGPVTVQVTANCGASSPVSGNLGGVRVDTASPEFFSSSSGPVTGRLYIAADNVAGGPITAGATVEAYGTGWGATNPAISPGAIPGSAAPLPAAPTLLLGGVPLPAADILYAGISPCCAGLYQVDFTIPAGTSSGDLPLVINVNGISSPANAYLTVAPSQ